MSGMYIYEYDEYGEEVPVYDHDDEEFPFLKGEKEGWELCGNCHNYICGRCLLDDHEVDYDDGCTYNPKKELKERKEEEEKENE